MNLAVSRVQSKEVRSKNSQVQWGTRTASCPDKAPRGENDKDVLVTPDSCSAPKTLCPAAQEVHHLPECSVDLISNDHRPCASVPVCDESSVI